jgi:hypothetical protein
MDVWSLGALLLAAGASTSTAGATVASGPRIVVLHGQHAMWSRRTTGTPKPRMVCERGASTRCAATRDLVRRPGPAGTETAVKVAQIRPWGCLPYPAYKPPGGHMRDREIPWFWPDSVRFCRDPGTDRDNSPNLGPYGPLRDHPHHIKVPISEGSEQCFCLPVDRRSGTRTQPAVTEIEPAARKLVTLVVHPAAAPPTR